MIRKLLLAWMVMSGLEAGWSSVSGRIVINEIHYNPSVKTELTEFIELYNDGSNTVDLAGWKFTSGVQFQFPAGSQLVPGGYLVVAENPVALRHQSG